MWMIDQIWRWEMHLRAPHNTVLVCLQAWILRWNIGHLGAEFFLTDRGWKKAVVHWFRTWRPTYQRHSAFRGASTKREEKNNSAESVGSEEMGHSSFPIYSFLLWIHHCHFSGSRHQIIWVAASISLSLSICVSLLLSIFYALRQFKDRLPLPLCLGEIYLGLALGGGRGTGGHFGSGVAAIGEGRAVVISPSLVYGCLNGTDWQVGPRRAHSPDKGSRSQGFNLWTSVLVLVEIAGEKILQCSFKISDPADRHFKIKIIGKLNK